MSVALRGNLQDFGIAEVFQLIGQQRKTGLLDVSHGDQTVRLAFDAGRVVWGRPVEGGEDVVLGERLRALRAASPRRGSRRCAPRAPVRRGPSFRSPSSSGDLSAEDAAQIEELSPTIRSFSCCAGRRARSTSRAQAVATTDRRTSCSPPSRS